AAFGAGAGITGYTVVARAARKSAHRAVQVFLAVAAVKVIAFAAFLLTIALATTLNPAALAAGLVGTTLTGEALVIGSLQGLEGFTEQDRRRQ
ncbi:MAG TPA: hypothetical protein VNI57_01075, partial [Candidatus Saccharimonadales bacterium]|nr:hypothetical protein [Candidatus Saccharimonadales bacterium]